jgi:hypothetical protein
MGTRSSYSVPALPGDDVTQRIFGIGKAWIATLQTTSGNFAQSV